MKTDPKERLDELKEMLAARTDMRGRPLSGYQHNVEMIRAEMARLEVVLELEETKAELARLKAEKGQE